MKEKKYGLVVAMSMVVGIVVGSGIFFLSDDILKKSGGTVGGAMLAWMVGGVAMIFGALAMANYAQRHSKANGLVDYFEEVCGQKAGYIMGWILSILYYPAIPAVIALVAATYTSTLFNFKNPETGAPTIIIGILYLISINLMITFSRYLSSRLQVSATIIKLIPIFLLAIVGTAYAIFGSDPVAFAGSEQVLTENKLTGKITFAGISAASIATAFAFDGWIVATGINDEIKDSKKTLPRALIFGSIIVFAIYIMYFIGMVLTVGVDTIITEGNNAVDIAFNELFGPLAADVLVVFIIISCLGTITGLQMVMTKVSYQLALRNTGIAPNIMVKVNKKTNTPVYSSLFGLLLMLIMYFILIMHEKEVVEVNIAELPFIIMYSCFSILYVISMIKFKDLGIVKRFVFPILATAGAAIIVIGGIMAPAKVNILGIEMRASIFGILISILVILIGFLFYNKKTVVNLDVPSDTNKEDNK